MDDLITEAIATWRSEAAEVEVRKIRCSCPDTELLVRIIGKDGSTAYIELSSRSVSSEIVELWDTAVPQ